MGDELEVIDATQPSAIAQITASEINTQIATAKQFPRQLSQVRNNVLSLATMDVETAGACFFSLPRGGKTITGESVRFAEILASSYGNLRSGSRPINVDRVNGVVTCQGFCHDLENNVSSTVEKTRKVQKKRGATGYDEDMIMLAINAGCSIVLRDAIFKVVPKAMFKAIMPDIKDAARGKGTLDQKVDRICNYLVKIGGESGIDAKQMEKRILASVEATKRADIDLNKLDLLIGMGTSVKDGEARFTDVFPDPKQANASGMDGKFGKKAESAPKQDAPKEKDAPAPKAETAPAEEADPAAVQYEKEQRDELEQRMMDSSVSEKVMLTYCANTLGTAKTLKAVKDLPISTVTQLINTWGDVHAATS